MWIAPRLEMYVLYFDRNINIVTVTMQLVTVPKMLCSVWQILSFIVFEQATKYDAIIFVRRTFRYHSDIES